MPPLNSLELLIGQIEGKLQQIDGTVNRITGEVTELQKKVAGLEKQFTSVEKLSSQHLDDKEFNEKVNIQIEHELNKRAVAAPKERRMTIQSWLGIISLVVSILIGIFVLVDKLNKTESHLPKTEVSTSK